MTFANPLPWWGLVLVTAGAAALAWHAYRGLRDAASARWTLSALRFTALVVIVLFLMRPVARSTEADARGAVVPVLVDVSRSMGIADEDGARRIDRARALLDHTLLPGLREHLQVELLSFGEALQPADTAALAASARVSDLSGALAAVRERYRGRPVAGILVLSDGGDTGDGSDPGEGPPIHTIALGSPALEGDREVLSVTAADAVLDDSRIELAVSAVSHDRANAPFDLRLLANGRPVEVRRVTPVASGVPVHETFHVSPAGGAATVYTVDVPAPAGDLVPENNSRSALVQPPARRRRVLLAEGAPGFEHSFLKRAWVGDRELEIDSVVRKGRNEQGRDTFYIQAVRTRSDALRDGYPRDPEALFQYDAIVLANMPGHLLTRAQLEATRRFVAERGGGLLVLGAQSFDARGLNGTALEEVLPLDLNDRRGGVLPAARVTRVNRVVLTPDGEAHPVMQLAAARAETVKRWEAVPALAAIASLGGPRPGASVLAMTGGGGGVPRALVAVQRFGEGRAMVFAGEAAWRWRMMLPASDHAYETFWRQAVRWISIGAVDPVALGVPAAAASGERLAVRVTARNPAFEPQRDAEVRVRVSGPDGRLEEARATADPAGGPGRYLAHVRAGAPGVYRVTADARRGDTPIGTAATSLLVGGADIEMSDPRTDVALLQRVAERSGGRLVRESELEALTDALRASAPAAALSVRRDLWHNGWSLAALLVLLGTEWVLRRRWGLR